jgi:hypothetical protein
MDERQLDEEWWLLEKERLMMVRAMRSGKVETEYPISLFWHLYDDLCCQMVGMDILVSTYRSGTLREAAAS